MKTVIPGVAEYNYVGVIVFEGQDRTIMLEQGEGYGLKPDVVCKVLKENNIKFEIITEK